MRCSPHISNYRLIGDLPAKTPRSSRRHCNGSLKFAESMVQNCRCTLPLPCLLVYHLTSSIHQLVQALMDVLPGSPYYALLCSLPEPDSTNPTATTTFWMQCAIHDSYPILEEVVSIVEGEEQARFTKEFNTRRTRLGAPKPDIIRKELDREICNNSQVRAF